MRALQVNVLEVKPAVVNFNYEELLQVAKEIKAEYEGLVFDEESIKAGKDTVAEIKKIQKSINDFKIKTKKDLTESVSLFETQCKNIIAEFDDPISFIQTQLDEYEAKRIESKKIIINGIIDGLKAESGVSDKFFNVLFNDKWLNKTVGVKEITDDLVIQFNQMVSNQNAYYNKLELIKSQVELANAKHQLKVELSETAFLHLAESKEMEEIKSIINQSAEQQKEKEETYTKQAEQNARVEAAKIIETVTEQIDSILPVEKNPDDKLYTRTITITGTKAQLVALKNYLEQVGIEVM